MITAYAEAIRTTWFLTVLPRPNLSALEEMRHIALEARELAGVEGEYPFTRIIQALSRSIAASDSLTPIEIEVVTKMVNDLPSLRRRSSDGEGDRKALVLFADGYGQLAKNLCLALAQMSIDICMVSDLDELSSSEKPEHLDASLVVVGADVLQSQAAIRAINSYLTKIREMRGIRPPVVLATEASLSFEQRLCATQLGSVRIFRSDDDPRMIRDMLTTITAEAKLAGSKVLLIDDSPTDAYRATTYMRAAGLLVEHVYAPEDTLDAIRNFGPDLIVMDYHMPVVNGDTLAALIRQDPEMTMPIIFLSSETDSEKQLLALSHGADGFVLKPLQEGAFIKAITSMINRAKAIDRRMRRDPLTQLLNHGQTVESVKRVIAEKRGGALAIIDIDHFKSVNDTYGHPVGDRVLIKMADVLTASLRDTDTVGRMGGEEFAVLLPDTTTEAARVVLERIRKCFMVIKHEVEGSGFSCTFSCGIADLSSGLNEAFRQADEALYLAKHSGRNQVIIAEPSV